MDALQKCDDQPLTPAGRLLLQPQLNQIIHCAITGKLPIDLESIKPLIESSIMLKHPRFCSLMVRDSLGREHWKKTEVDLDRHVMILHNSVSDDPSIHDEDAVNDYVADLCVSSPLSIDKPLWEIHILVAHKTALFRLHHALGDGISLMSMLLTCCRRADDSEKLPSIGSVAKASSLPRWRWSVRTVVKVVWYTLIYVLEFVLRGLWLRDKTTAVSGGAGVELWPRKLATARLQLEDMKTVKRAVADATINDVLFGVISFGLSKYLNLLHSKAPPEGCKITGVAMVNLRQQQEYQDLSETGNVNDMGNKFGMILLPAYYHKHESDPLQFVKRAKAMVDKKKLSLEALCSYKIGDLIMSLFGPKVAGTITYRILCNTTFTISNVIGPGEDISIGGNPVKHIRVTSSSLPHAITMHMVSYAGVAEMQILVAKEVIPEPKLLAKCVQDALLLMKEAAAPPKS